MQSMLVVLGVIVGVIVLLAMFIAGIYNGLVTLRNRYKNAYSQIDVQLKRRYDLIPNLVEAVKGYMAHEKGTLNEVIEARNRAMSAGQQASANPGDPNAMQKLNQAEGQLGGALGRMFALSEAYPDLKANQNFLALQEELTSTESRVAYARQFYNDSVLGYHNQLDTFPTILIAKLGTFNHREFFEAED